MQTASELHFQEWVDLGHEERDDKELSIQKTIRSAAIKGKQQVLY